MAQLTIIYDDLEPPLTLMEFPDIRVARLPLAAGLADLEIYDAAKRLAELLLEQLSREADGLTIEKMKRGMALIRGRGGDDDAA